MSSDTTDNRKRWQVWALMARPVDDLETWRPVTMKYRDKRTADRVADQLWLTVGVREVEDEDES